MQKQLNPIPKDDNNPDKKEWAYTHHRELVTGDLNAVLVKAEPTLLYGFTPSIGSGTAFLKFYNTSITPGPGAMIPYRTFKINTSTPYIDFSTPLMFDRGLAYAITSAINDTDASLPTITGELDVSFR